MRKRAVLALTLLGFGCLADKGDEDPLPGDGKADSSAQPTDHGTLAFGSANEASFNTREGYHAWSFTLTDAASVTLETTLGAPNLDTVLYVYKRTSPTAAWGQYIARDDDASDATAASRLSVDLGAAEYRVLVKPYKETQLGAFAVVAACSGAGCPSSASMQR